MAVDGGASIITLRAAIQTALDAATLTIGSSTVQLSKAIRPRAGGQCQHGGFTVSLRGEWIGPSVPGSTSLQQAKWSHRATVTVTLQTSRITADKLDTDLYAPIRSLINTIQDALEPTAGPTIYAINGVSYGEPQQTEDALVYTIEFRVHEWWA